ncbi:MAG: SpoVK/Ycf46/Vps4 family AAA+-type ATPase [Myxococcota bacterium]|jgi:SpoVK/Ycf46/Vps4 family AAA+-type ATPase
MTDAYTDHHELLEEHLLRLGYRIQARASLFDPNYQGEEPDALIARADALETEIASRVEASKNVRLPLMEVVQRFNLDPLERDVLLLALAPSLDLEFARSYGRLQQSPLRGELNVDLALTLLTSGKTRDRIAARRYFTIDASLAKHHLISLDRHRIEMGDSFLNLGLRLPPRMLGWLLGEDNLDESMRGFSKLLEPDETFDQVVLPAATRDSIRAMVHNHADYLTTLKDWKLDERIGYGRGIVLLFVGAPGTGKTMTAKAVASELGKRLLLVDPNQIYDVKRPVEDNLDELFREARLQNAVVFFDECEGLLGARVHGNAQVSLILSAIEHYDGIIVLSTNLPQLLDQALDRRVLYRVVFEPPTVGLRRKIWDVHLTDETRLADDVDLDLLARQFDFTGGYIKNAVLVAINRALTRPERPPTLYHEDLDAAARTQMRARLSEYAERTPTPLRLTDVILPKDTASQVNEILAAARSRSTVFEEWGFGAKLTKGRGLSALFDGEPGTGKTLCCEILAAELGLTLYRIQVANVVSKYIGETEKALTRIFKEADQSHCLLLFDEADSLFSQRTDVKSVQDKYSNMEINVLLQLMERYDGLVLLTTNLKKGIDKAFERRLSYKVHFPFPEPEDRGRIWEHLIPSTAPTVDDIDYYVLGKSFELSGGSIKNSIVRAAYGAAAARRPIGMADLVNAAKYECAAAGKLYRLPQAEDF